MIANNRIDVLTLENTMQEKEITESRSKVVFADVVNASDNTILIGDITKLVKQNGHPIVRNDYFNG